ncbi:MAG TPA: AMP-dependent synthetase [Flavobacteriaceae bacterium]|jgi:long-chain acyl-CoA synthetase|nr:AMP-dependent synthetase [Flavobacteriaceae bacterium]HBS10929.1 AMP-dependent synthetase [Flavobacteriaceae bacterium]
MIKFDSPLAAFLHWEKKTPDNIFLRQHIDGKLKIYTYKESGDQARRIATDISTYNFPPQSKIALLSKNCAHWMLADLAIMMSGHVSIPIYPTLKAETIKYVLEHSEAKAIILGKLEDYESQKSAIVGIPKISVAMYGVNDGTTWEDLLKQNNPLQSLPKLEPKNLITIIYTSGTTGKPKGVMHTVASFTNASNQFLENLKLPEHPKFFSYLPLSHIAERIGIEMGGIYRGASITFSESLPTFASNLEATQPDLFFAVPRIWAKFQEKILQGMPQKKLNLLLGLPIINSIVKKKIKKKLGLTKAALIYSGAAPIASSLMRWYKKLDIIILQGYGMTEDCILSHSNTPEDNKIGTVGKTTNGAKAKLGPDGEICILNDCLMTGYYKNPEATAEAFDSEGYLRTGDIGEFDFDGFLTITGRAKDQFKTDKGKYIAPAPIELELSKNTDIEQICLVGMGIPQPILLVVLSEEGKKKSKEAVSECLIKAIKDINPSLEKHEKIEKAVIMKNDWTVENGLMTPTLKIKRSQVEKIHMPMYKTWFDAKERVIFL